MSSNHLVSAHMQLNRKPIANDTTPKATTTTTKSANTQTQNTYEQFDNKMIKIEKLSKEERFQTSNAWECSNGFAIHKCPVP